MNFHTTVRILCLVLIAALVASCATPATRSELTPAYTAQAPSKVTIGVIDNRTYVVSGEKEPWFEGLYRPTLQVRDGLVQIPEGPGWGVQINPRWMAHAELQVSEL